MEHQSLTLGVIAGRLGVPVHRVQYVIRTRQIKPVERVGNVRVFAGDIVEQLRQELKADPREKVPA